MDAGFASGMQPEASMLAQQRGKMGFRSGHFSEGARAPHTMM